MIVLAIGPSVRVSTALGKIVRNSIGPGAMTASASSTARAASAPKAAPTGRSIRAASGRTSGFSDRPRRENEDDSKIFAKRPAFGGRGAYRERPRDDDRRSSRREEEAKPKKAGERIAKALARAGLASRRDAEEMVTQGRVTVNGRVINSPALDITENDVVAVDGKPLPPRERTRLWMYHKPRGLMTTHADPEGRPTVFDNLPEGLPRLISVGRLDFNTEGLLLLTNDGGLARALELPDTGWLRRYRVRAHGEVTQAQLDQLKDGVEVDGVKYGSIDATLERDQGANVWLVFAIREGKNREVRNVMAHLGLEVNRLIRISYGPFQLAELEEGKVEEVKTRVLREQLGEKIAKLAGAEFNRPPQGEGAVSNDTPPKKPYKASGKNAICRRRQGPPRAGAAHRQRGIPRPQRGRERRLRPAPPRQARLSRQARSQAEGRVAIDARRRGRLRGRNLASPAYARDRPTADRLRESVFNILMHAYDNPIEDARVLDLFAGTGALGIEAISRGAKFVLFVDNGAEARALLRNNVELLGLRRRDKGLSPRRHQSRTCASARAVLAGVSRSALWQGAGGKIARRAARRRLADAGRACWWWKRRRRRGLPRRRDTRSWSAGRMTIRSLCFCAARDADRNNQRRHRPA